VCLPAFSPSGSGGTLSSKALNVCLDGGAMLQYFCTLFFLFFARRVRLGPPLIAASCVCEYYWKEKKNKNTNKVRNFKIISK